METAKNTEFFHQFNDAFFQGNRQFIADHITEDVVWIMVGSEPIVGKVAFLDTAFGLDSGFSDLDYSVDFSLTDDKSAVIKGKMIQKRSNGLPKAYAYCDIYLVNDEDDCKINELTTFVLAETDD